MYKIFLIIIVFQYIKANDESNEKYIDLLPEEEKQVFLNRIARRILEEVNSPDIPNESQAEVNEEQLDAQNAYVKQIIKEESKMLQNEKLDNVVRNDQETNNGGEKKSDIEPHIDLTYRTRSNEERNNSELNDHLDARRELEVLPVRNDQENVNYHDNSASTSESNVSTRAVHDNDVKTELGKDRKNELIATNDTNNTENVNILRKSHDDKLFLSTTISNYDPSSEENTAVTEDENIVSTSTISPDYISNATETDNEINWISTMKIYDESNENINPERAERISSSNVTTITDEEQLTTSSVTNITLQSKKSEQEMTTLKTPESRSNLSQLSSKKNLKKHLYVGSGTSLKYESNVTQLPHNDSNVTQLTPNDSNVTQLTQNDSNETQLSHNDSNETQLSHNDSNETQLSHNDSNETQLSHNDSNETQFTHIDSNITQLTRNDLSDLKTNESDMNSVNKIVNDSVPETNIMNSNDSKSNASDTRSIYLVNNNKENITELQVKDSNMSLRASSASKESEIDALEKYNLKSDVKQYEVFEVAADKPPFEKKSNVETKDTPYYVPVYKYEPDNAYFRPRSQFEPNEDSNEDKKKNYRTYNSSTEVHEVVKKLQLEPPIVRSIFSGYNKRAKPSYEKKPGKYTIKKQTDNIFHFSRPINKNILQKIYYNPNDYLDMDYYYGRGNIKQLRNGGAEDDSNEKWFPDTDDEDHAYHTIHKSNSVKDHLRDVRKLLYLKQIFEPIPEIKNKEPRKFYNKRIQSQNVNKKYNKRDELRNNDNIASDYYFGVIPYPRALQAVSIKKPYQNKYLRKPENDKYDQFNATSNKLNTKLDKVEPILNVLRDFIRFDNQALSRYNWLESTVDILAAIKKLLELITQLQFEKRIHPKDLELLKYILYLYKTSFNTLKKEIPEEFNNEEKIQLKQGLLPRSKWNSRIREPLKLWRAVANYVRSNYQQERAKLLCDFEEFLQNVLFSLNDFHDAIKHIAIITKYNNQKWYEDLKNIYLHNANNEKLLTLLLHVSVTKLLNSIETSATDGAENNFKHYLINNKQYVLRSKEEFLFVLNILHEMRRLNKT